MKKIILVLIFICSICYSQKNVQYDSLKYQDSSKAFVTSNGYYGILRLQNAGKGIRTDTITGQLYTFQGRLIPMFFSQLSSTTILDRILLPRDSTVVVQINFPYPRGFVLRWTNINPDTLGKVYIEYNSIQK